MTATLDSRVKALDSTLSAKKYFFIIGGVKSAYGDNSLHIHVQTLLTVIEIALN